MSEWREAVHKQPANLAAAAEAFTGAIAELDLAPLQRGTIVFAGIGASAHALIPAVLALRAAGRRAFALQATELDDRGARELADAFVLVSQSGASTETVAALERIGGMPMVAITARGDSPLAEASHAWLPLGPEPDTPVATLSYTATLQALGMLCDALLGTTGSVWSELPSLAEEVLVAGAEPAAALAADFAELTALEAVGGGPGLASARETALLAREALRLPATGMETREYLHGPLEAVAPGFGAVIFGRERERALAESMASFGAHVLLVGDRNDDVPGVTLPEVPPIAAPILQILPAQLLVDEVATRRGLTIGELRRHQDDTKVVSGTTHAASVQASLDGERRRSA
jgi:glucosamine--fructose-6-phosphate aminotransferase (isomerizing)